MSEIATSKLFKSSDLASRDNVQHVVLVMTPDGRLRVNGSHNMVDAVNLDPNIFNFLENKLRTSYVDTGMI